MKTRISILLIASVCIISQAAWAQVDREDGVKSVARLLDGPAGAFFDDFTFRSNHPQILFATIDGDLYQTMGRRAHDPGHEEPSADDEGGGCADEGGPGGFCLQVLDANQNIICWADRPMRPGWQRDPRLACPLFPISRGGESYTLRVSLRGEGEDPCGPGPGGIGMYPEPGPNTPEHPYLLDVSLRDIAPEGDIKPAIAQSKNRF